MKLHEARIAAQKSDNWFRPVAWGGSGCAIEICNGAFRMATDYRPDPHESTARVETLMIGEWEVVSRYEVMAERGGWE